MHTLALLTFIGFVSMLLLGAVSLVKGRRLKCYVKEKHPSLFAELYGDGTLFGKGPRNDVARMRFIHAGIASSATDDSSLCALRLAVRAINRLYLAAFAITVVSFLALILVRHT